MGSDTILWLRRASGDRTSSHCREGRPRPMASRSRWEVRSEVRATDLGHGVAIRTDFRSTLEPPLGSSSVSPLWALLWRGSPPGLSVGAVEGPGVGGGGAHIGRSCCCAPWRPATPLRSWLMLCRGLVASRGRKRTSCHYFPQIHRSMCFLDQSPDGVGAADERSARWSSTHRVNAVLVPACRFGEVWLLRPSNTILAPISPPRLLCFSGLIDAIRPACRYSRGTGSHAVLLVHVAIAGRTSSCTTYASGSDMVCWVAHRDQLRCTCVCVSC